eukprot:scaffold113357_cov52-Attheya_sp.AAC.2
MEQDPPHYGTAATLFWGAAVAVEVDGFRWGNKELGLVFAVFLLLFQGETRSYQKCFFHVGGCLGTGLKVWHGL